MPVCFSKASHVLGIKVVGAGSKIGSFHFIRQYIQIPAFRSCCGFPAMSRFSYLTFTVYPSRILHVRTKYVCLQFHLYMAYFLSHTSYVQYDMLFGKKSRQDSKWQMVFQPRAKNQVKWSAASQAFSPNWINQPIQ